MKMAILSKLNTDLMQYPSKNSVIIHRCRNTSKNLYGTTKAKIAKVILRSQNTVRDIQHLTQIILQSYSDDKGSSVPAQKALLGSEKKKSLSCCSSPFLRPNQL